MFLHVEELMGVSSTHGGAAAEMPLGSSRDNAMLSQEVLQICYVITQVCITFDLHHLHLRNEIFDFSISQHTDVR